MEERIGDSVIESCTAVVGIRRGRGWMRSFSPAMRAKAYRGRRAWWVKRGMEGRKDPESSRALDFALGRARASLWLS